MNFSKKDFATRLARAADALIEKSDALSAIDARFGDGDHGITIKKIAGFVKSEISSWDDAASFGDFFKTLEKGIMGLSGGSAGPLWGTMFGGFSLSLKDKFELGSPDIVQMFCDSLSEMREITAAKVGDKTMMDVLIPTVEAVKNAPRDNTPEELLKLAAQTAEVGCKATEGFVSKFGRAKNYKEQTLGTPDVGAVSLATLFAGLAE